MLLLRAKVKKKKPSVHIFCLFFSGLKACDKDHGVNTTEKFTNPADISSQEKSGGGMNYMQLICLI